MARERTRDLTTGSPFRLVLGFTIPLLFGFFFQQLYSFVDAAIVGRTLGAEALAAVGSTGSLNFMVLGLCGGMCSGFAIPVALNFGARDYQQMRRYIMNAAYLCAALSVTIGVVTGIFSRTFLIWMNTPAEILDNANTYISLIFWGIPATVLYNMASGIMRSLGDSKTPVFFLVMASVMNIVLDLFFIAVLKTGVIGAAIATVISQLVSGLCCVITLIRRFGIVHPSAEERTFRPDIARHLISIGLPMGLQFSITAIGSIAMQTATNSLGTVYVAATTAANKLVMFFNCIFDALASTMATFAGQNIGARKPERINKGLYAAGVIGTVYSLVAYVVLSVAGTTLLQLFLDAGETEVLGYAHQYMMVNVTYYVLLLLVNIVRLSIQGMGYTQLAMIAGTLEMIARTFVGMVLIPIFGYDAACYSGPAAWLAADIFLLPAYFIIINKLKKRYAADPAA